MRLNKRFRRILPLTIAALAPVAGVALFYAAGGAARTGADERAQEAVRSLHSYQPWFEPVWSPPNPTAEALLFIVQAAAGAAVLGFAIVRLRARRKS